MADYRLVQNVWDGPQQELEMRKVIENSDLDVKLLFEDPQVKLRTKRQDPDHQKRIADEYHEHDDDDDDDDDDAIAKSAVDEKLIQLALEEVERSGAWQPDSTDIYDATSKAVHRACAAYDTPHLQDAVENVLHSRPDFMKSCAAHVDQWCEQRRAHMKGVFGKVRDQDAKTSRKMTLKLWSKSSLRHRPQLMEGDHVRVALRAYDKVASQMANEEGRSRLRVQSQGGVNGISTCQPEWFACGPLARSRQKNTSQSQRSTHVWFSAQIFVVTKSIMVNTYTDQHSPCVIEDAYDKDGREFHALCDATRYVYEIRKWEHSDEADGTSDSLIYKPLTKNRVKRRYNRSDLLYIPEPQTTVSRANGDEDGPILCEDHDFRDLQALQMALPPA